MALSSLIWALIALVFPPLPVAIRKGCSGHLILNIILLLLAWIPAVLHAWYVILEYDSSGQKKIDRRIRRAKDEERVEALRKEDVGQGDKMEMPAAVGGQMGNQHGWYGPLPTEQQGVQRRDDEKAMQLQQKSQQIPVQKQQQEPPEYARDMKM